MGWSGITGLGCQHNAGASCHIVLEGHTWPVVSVSVDFVCGRILSTSGQGVLKVWDLDSGSCIRTLAGHEGLVAAAADFANGRAASGGEEGSFRIWDLDSMQSTRIVQAAHDGPVHVVVV